MLDSGWMWYVLMAFSVLVAIKCSGFQGKEQADLVVRILEEPPVIDVDVEEVFRKATLDLVEVYLSQVFISMFLRGVS